MRPLPILLCLTATAGLLAQPAPVQAAPSQPALTPTPRIAVMFPDRIIDRSERARKLFAELEQLQKTLSDKIQAKRTEIQKLTNQLQSPSISEAGRETIQKQLRDLEFDDKKLQEDSQAEFQKTKQKVFTQFQQEIGPIVEKLAKEQNLQLVMTYQPGLMAYADQAWVLNFTDEVGKRYDAQYGIQPAPKPAPKPKS